MKKVIGSGHILKITGNPLKVARVLGQFTFFAAAYVVQVTRRKKKGKESSSSSSS
jgi:hypothetical protein